MHVMRSTWASPRRTRGGACPPRSPAPLRALPEPEPRAPLELERDVVYACAGASGADVRFTLRLPFVDETRDPPAPAQFHHEWILPRGELERAEDQGVCDQLILDVRVGEQRRFLAMIERTLGRQRARLVRRGVEWVLRRVSGRDREPRG